MMLAMGVIVRQAGPDDVAALTDLRRTWNEEDGGPVDDPGFAGAFGEWVAREAPTRTFFLVEVDGAAAGMANVKRYDRMPVAGRPSGGFWGYVGNVYVRPEHRDGGVGAQLMQGVIAWAWSEGMGHLRLAPSPRSRRFYARLGFEPGAVVELDPPT
jgi:GNAT superfamily N-acetyltransferase